MKNRTWNREDESPCSNRGSVNSVGIKFPFATFAKSSPRRAWVVRNANDDSKRNSKELQPKIDDTLWRAERHGKGANTRGVQKTIVTSREDLFFFKVLFMKVNLVHLWLYNY